MNLFILKFLIKNMNLEDKTKKQIMKGKEVTIIITPLTINEAQQMFPYRPHNKYSESRFGGNNLYDDTALLLNDRAKRCEMCHAPKKTEYLNPYCPDCDGRSEYNGANPKVKR